MKARAVTIAISLLVALGAMVPGRTVLAVRDGELLEGRTGEAGRLLTVGLLVLEGGQSFQVTGPGVSEYELYLDQEGTLRLRFPGASLVSEDDLTQAQADLPADQPGTLVVSLDGRRVTSVVASDEAVRVTLSDVVAPVRAEYTIGIGDKLRVTIHGDADLKEQEVRVVGEGTVTVPYLGVVQVAGLTEAEAAAEITRRLAAGYLREPKLSLEVIEYQSQWVNVSGQVAKPGRYYLRGPTTLVDILAEAGGLKKEAGSEVRIVRSLSRGRSDHALAVRTDSLYLTDDPAANPLLRSGDTITVSEEEYFFIKGEVRNPGRYPVNDGTTILKAISLAGGFDEFANQKKVELLRAENSETVRLVINIERIENRKADDIRILPGDIINVKARFL